MKAIQIKHISKLLYSHQVIKSLILYILIYFVGKILLFNLLIYHLVFLETISMALISILYHLWVKKKYFE